MIKKIVREFRDAVYSIIFFSRKTVEIEGVRLIAREPTISKRMFYILNRGYERGDAIRAGRFLVPSDRVLEVGSSISFMALYCKLRIGISDYVMVEANADVCDLARRNFAFNKLDAPNNVNAAVCSSHRPVLFNKNREFWSSSISNRRGTQEAVVLNGESLETIISDLEFSPNTLIMDIEGAEVEIPIDYFGAFEKIIIEVHPTLTGQKSVDRLLTELAGSGFETVDRLGASYALVRHGAAR